MAEYLGVPFRQLAHRLRVNRGPGKPDKVSERPRASDRRFLDSDEAPTLITFDEFDQVNVAELLRTSAIEPYTPPKPPAKGGG